MVKGDIAFNIGLSSSRFVAKVHSSSTTDVRPSEVEVVKRFMTWIRTDFQLKNFHGHIKQQLHTLLMIAIIR